MSPISEDQFRQMRDRTDRARGVSISSTSNEAPKMDKGVESEAALHDDILAECRRRRWVAFHGSMAHRAMRTLGEFDFTILADRGVVIFVEAKSRRGKLRPEQAALKMAAELLGHRVHVVRSFGEFLRAAEAEMSGKAVETVANKG